MRDDLREMPEGPRAEEDCATVRRSLLSLLLGRFPNDRVHPPSKVCVLLRHTHVVCHLRQLPVHAPVPAGEGVAVSQAERHTGGLVQDKRAIRRPDRPRAGGHSDGRKRPFDPEVRRVLDPGGAGAPAAVVPGGGLARAQNALAAQARPVPAAEAGPRGQVVPAAGEGDAGRMEDRRAEPREQPPRHSPRARAG